MSLRYGHVGETRTRVCSFCGAVYREACYVGQPTRYCSPRCKAEQHKLTKRLVYARGTGRMSAAGGVERPAETEARA